eukprot:TRINITY_DN69816_c0_g1_i1.p2 TRINITY_DN69816_c0_g1~~TRINITY_DN69816_c0_g1_i1.p2  ORF type:complete len:184 (-),score=47.78 TRINITY_DN69816_c0_g1_i1:377-928(-)
MPGLLGLLRSLKKSDKDPRILILGLDNAGKTTALKKLSDEKHTETQATKGFNIKQLHHDGFNLNVWDIGGQKAIREFWPDFYDDTDILIYVVDAADAKRFDEASYELNQLLAQPQLAGVPLLVFANKQDLVTASPPSQISDKLALTAIRDRKWHIQGCSATTGDGLQGGLEWSLKEFKGAIKK